MRGRKTKRDDKISRYACPTDHIFIMNEVNEGKLFYYNLVLFFYN